MRLPFRPLAALCPLLLALPACNEARPSAAEPAVVAAAPAPAAAAAPATDPAPAAAAAPDPAPAGDGAAPAAAPACGATGGPACGGGDHHDPVPVEGAVPAAAGAQVQLDGTVYGAGVTLTETVPVSKLLADADAWAGKRVRIEGPITDVCQKRGCWMQLAGDKEFETIKFKVTDGVIVFPVEAKGKYAVAEGVVRKMPLSLEQTRNVMAHEAEEQGRPFDPASVTEPMTMVRLDGLGAVVRDKK